MIQLIVNVNLLRELDEHKLVLAYARLVYNDENDTTNDVQIKNNLIQLLDWDKNGDNGLGLYCSKFESIKRKDWENLIKIIKENKHEIKSLAYNVVKKRRLESIKIINTNLKSKELRNKERFTSKNYKVSGRGKKAKPCVYEGRHYISQQECMYKENLTKFELYKYLKETNQL